MKITKKAAVMGATLAVIGGGAGIAAAVSGAGQGGSRLDDGASLAGKAKISQVQAERAAQGAASGSLNETDLEYRDGKLVYNVDVGSSDVKVDASSGQVVAVDQDD
jgi:uncharacterized membrane protein YkoI